MSPGEIFFGMDAAAEGGDKTVIYPIFPPAPDPLFAEALEFFQRKIAEAFTVPERIVDPYGLRAFNENAYLTTRYLAAQADKLVEAEALRISREPVRCQIPRLPPPK